VGLLAALVGTVLAGCGGLTGESGGPRQLTIGTLYAGSGQFAGSSLPELAGLRFWIAWENRRGGAYVGSLDRRVPLRLVALDDRSSPSLAGRLYARLIERDHVDLLVSDFGSVLTSPAIPISEHAGMLLFDQSGSGSAFFLDNDPYLVLCDLPSSAVWPDPLVRFLLAEHLDRVALIYAGNDFDAAQDTTIAAALTLAGHPPVANLEVATSTRRYEALLEPLRARRAEAVIELGYQDNDLAFLPQIAAFRRTHPWPALAAVFSAFPGQLISLFRSQVGTEDLVGGFTYGFPPTVDHRRVSVGLDLAGFERSFAAEGRRSVNFLDVAGYNTGLVIQEALAHAASLSQLGLRAALNAVSGRFTTLEGVFRIDGSGAQLGETPPVAEFFATATGQAALRVVYPPDDASRGPVLAADRNQPAEPHT
jgi:branched-chain amino acid transport system substrate-binding protein